LEREALKLDRQLLEEKVGMIIKRAETAEQGRDKTLERAAALDVKLEGARTENHEQKQQILKLQAENKDVNQLRQQLKRTQRSLEDANKFLDDAVNEKAPLEIEVEKLSTKLEESQTQLRELQLHVYQEDLRTRDIRSRFDKMMDQLEKEQENRLFDADIFKEKERVLREFIDTLETQLKKEVEWHIWVETGMSEVEDVNARLHQLVPDVLQSRKEETSRALNRINDLEIRKSVLEEQVKTLNLALIEAEEEATAANEELNTTRSAATGKIDELKGYLLGTMREGRILETFPETLDKLESTIRHATQFVSTMKVDNEGAMADVRTTLQELQEQETALQGANKELTAKLSRTELQSSNLAKQKTQAVTERDAAMKLVRKAEQEVKEQGKMLTDAAGVLGPLDTLSQQLLGVVEFLSATILRQRTLSATEAEKEAEQKITKVRGELAEAQEANAGLATRNKELDAQQKKLRQEVLALQAIVKNNKAALSALAAAQMEKEEMVQSLASAHRDALEVATDLSQCAALTCEQLQGEMNERDLKIQKLGQKKRHKSPGKGKSKSPDKDASSWASFSVRTHENVVGSQRRSVSPGGSHSTSSRALSAHPEALRQRDLRRTRAASAVLSTRIQNDNTEGRTRVEGGGKGGRQSAGGTRLQILRERSDGIGADVSDRDLDIGHDDDENLGTWIGDSIMVSPTSSKRPASHIQSSLGTQSPHRDQEKQRIRIASARPSLLRPSTAAADDKRHLSPSWAGRFGRVREVGSDGPWGRPRTGEGVRKGGDVGLPPQIKRPLSSSKLLERVMQVRQEKEVVLVKCQMVSPAHRPATAITRANKGLVNARTSAAPRSKVVRTDSAAQLEDAFDEHIRQFEQRLRGFLHLSGPPGAINGASAWNTSPTHEVGDDIETTCTGTDNGSQEIRATATATATSSRHADILILSPMSDQMLSDDVLPGHLLSPTDGHLSSTAPQPLSPLSSSHPAVQRSSQVSSGTGGSENGESQEVMVDINGKRDEGNPRSGGRWEDDHGDVGNNQVEEWRTHSVPAAEEESRRNQRHSTSEDVTSWQEGSTEYTRSETAPPVPSPLPVAPSR
jgi:hypothetical protein